MQFHVRSIYLGDNAVNDCVMEVSDEATLRAQLVGEGQTILSLYSLVSSDTSSGWLSFFKPQKLESFPVFCRELHTLTQAGMSVVEAVDTLAAKEKIAKHVDTLPQALLAQLQQGKALSTSLAGLSNAPAVLVAAVRAGERTSNLSEALNDYLRFDTLVQQLRRKVISASIYPALVSSLGFAISVFLLVVVMPNFARMYQNLRGGTSGTTAIIITISSFVNKYQFEVVIGLLVVIVFSLWWIASGGARQFAMRLANAIPYIRHKIDDFYLAMMYQTLALLLKGGYPMTEAMSVAGQSALSRRINAALGQALTRIEQGALVSQSLADANLCDEVGRRLMAAAERNGAFHLAADVVSNMHRERFELFVERMTRIVEPVLLMAVALLVGTIVVMMYLPIFDMTTRVR